MQEETRNKKIVFVSFVCFVVFVVHFSRAAAQDNRRATTIVGADLADGSGAALRRANVRIQGDRIVASGAVKPQRGDVVINGDGLVVKDGR